MDLLTNLFDNSSMPWITAIALGLLTSISPCPLTTNITAVAYISKDIENRNRVFLNGLFYTLGRIITYTSIAFIIYLGADQFKFSGFFQRHGEKIIGPFLLVIGLLMFDLLKIRIPGIGNLYRSEGRRKVWRLVDVMFLGIVFALAFCPYSGVLFFGILIPMTVASASGFYLPLLFAIATGIPVIISALLIAYTISGIGIFYNKLKVFEIWFRRLIAGLFIIVGTYFILRVYLGFFQ